MSELRNAQWTLDAIENGSSNTSTIYKTAIELDPVVIHFIFKYIREIYNANNPASSGVMERLADLTKNFSDLVQRAKKGERDPICEWFNDTYRVREFQGRPNALLEIIVDKVES